MFEQTASTRLPRQAETSSTAAKTGELLDFEMVGSRRNFFWLIGILMNTT